MKRCFDVLQSPLSAQLVDQTVSGQGSTGPTGSYSSSSMSRVLHCVMSRSSLADANVESFLSHWSVSLPALISNMGFYLKQNHGKLLTHLRRTMIKFLQREPNKHHHSQQQCSWSDPLLPWQLWRDRDVHQLSS